MLRANRLKTFNPDIHKVTPMDHWMDRMGGVAYTNCYSPAPDTPRSLACLYTGLYPKNNGCEKRIQWPRYYLKDDCETVFDLLATNNYNLISNLTNSDIEVGIFPENIKCKWKNFESTSALLEDGPSIIQEEKIFIFLNLTDYHDCVNDYNAHAIADARGNHHLSNGLDRIFRTFDIEKFDYIFLFSDHGCKLLDDPNWARKTYLLNDDRSKIVMFVHKKGDQDIKIISEITSIIDVFPTMGELLETPIAGELDGVSLLNMQTGRSVTLEDHSIFVPSLGSYHDLWGVRTQEYLYLESLEEILLFREHGNSGAYERIMQPSESLLEDFRSSIRKNACSYEEIKKQNHILKFYRLLNSSKTSYTDGVKRPSGFRVLLYRIYTRLYKYILGIKGIIQK